MASEYHNRFKKGSTMPKPDTHYRVTTPDGEIAVAKTEIVSWYEKGESTVKIAKRLHCSRQAVNGILQRQGVKLRPSSNPKGGFPSRKNR